MTTSPPGTTPPADGPGPIDFRPVDSTSRGMLSHIRIAPDGQLALTTATLWPASVLQLLQAGVGGLVERVGLRNGIDAWIHEEGLVLGLPPNPIATAVCGALAAPRARQILLGPVVFCGQRDADAASLNAAQQLAILDAWRAAVRAHTNNPPVGRR